MALRTAIAAFHAVKLAGLLYNVGAFPVLDRSPGALRPTSILVPARDEERNLQRTLLGLLKQPAAEILVLDDGSIDGTAAVVDRLSKVDSRLRLLKGSPPPPGWVGKNWACHQLSLQASGQWLVFCDADVRLSAGAVAALWRQIDAQRADVFSVFPRQEAETLGERLLVPLIDEVLLEFLPHTLLDQPVPAAAAANGQLLAFSRTAYTTVGGHEAVASEIVEDLALARLARRRGLKLGLALGGDLVRTRMYNGYAATVRGFGKSMRAAHNASSPLLIGSALFHLAAYSLPWLMPGRLWRASAAMGVAQRLIVNAKTGRGSYAEGALVPFTAPAALPVYALGLRRTAQWKGRAYT
jgi:glycosyltransferase involved in cell wall biosynthesis